MLITTSGNLLTADVEALVNTVNCVGVMGKGLALQFKHAFPEASREYEQAAKSGKVRPGHVFAVRTGQLTGPRWILHFPTKRHWKQDALLEDIQTGLDDLARLIGEQGIRSVALPALGAGLGGLSWPDVRREIESRLAGLQDVRVLIFPPTGAPPATAPVVSAKRPVMTAVRATLLDAMQRYTIWGESLTLIEVQKLAYFLETAGVPLRLQFARHHYGPYSERLYHALKDMESHQISGLNARAPETEILVQEIAVDEARTWLAGQSVEAEHVNRVAKLIDGYESPYGMELLATVHWVCRDDPAAIADVNVCIEHVHGWSTRKRNIMQPEHIRRAWERLNSLGWLRAA